MCNQHYVTQVVDTWILKPFDQGFNHRPVCMEENNIDRDQP
jgi:hypothetical protein